MRRRSVACLAVAGLIAAAGSAAAQKPVPEESPAQNVRESQQYEQLLRADPAFRAKRMQAECGPISDKGLYAQCIASFGAQRRGSQKAPPSETIK